MPARARLGCFTLVWLALLLVASPARAAFGFRDSSWQGTSELLAIAQKELGRDRVRVVDKLDYDQLKPADGVIVLHPLVHLDYEDISAFLRAGGRLALLDDYGTAAPLLEHFHIHRIPAPAHPAEMLRDNPQLAIAVPAVQQVAGYEQGRHPVVAKVQKLVTNHPTALVHPNLTPVLTIPAVGEPDATLAVTGIIVNRGRLFAMGDPSAVINLMLRYPGNRAFAKGLIEYLVEDDTWGRRGGTLYVLSEHFQQSGHYGGGSTISQDLHDYLEGFLEMLGDVHRDGLPDSLALVLAGLVSLGGLAWMGLVATRPYRRRIPRYAAATPLVAQGGIAGRAAVLAAPTTHRGLALLELKSALEEGLAHRLGLDSRVATATLLSEIDRQNALGRRSSGELKQMLDELKRVEASVTASQPVRVKKGDVERIRKQVLAILAEVDEQLGSVR